MSWEEIEQINRDAKEWRERVSTRVETQQQQPAPLTLVIDEEEIHDDGLALFDWAGSRNSG